jgi:hypothetical protein
MVLVQYYLMEDGEKRSQRQAILPLQRLKARRKFAIIE